MTKANPIFSIIIVTHDGLPLLKRFLPAVASSTYPEMEIIVADNHSVDKSDEWTGEHFPKVKFLKLDQNYGYSGGNNRAAKVASGDVLLFLNNDAAPCDPDWLTPIAALFKSGDADIVQPKLLSDANPELFDYSGAAGGFIDWLAYPFCRGRIFDTIEQDSGQYNERSALFWASGAAFAIRKELYLELGGFDETFRFHMEEIDLCWRALKRGKRILFEPESKVKHLGGGSLDAESPEKVFYNYRNSLLMLVKNAEKALLPKLFLRLVLDGISGIRYLLKGKPLFTLAVIRSHFSFYALSRYAFKERKTLQNEDKKHLERVIFPRLILFQYFFLGKRTFSEIEPLFNK